jgi:hypothetical protein
MEPDAGARPAIPHRHPAIVRRQHGANLGETINANELYPNTLGYAAALKNAPFPQFYNILDLVNGARSNYNAVTIALNKRMPGGLQFQSSYTFARNLSNGAGTAPTAFAGEGGGTATHQYDFNLDYGNVAYTRRNRFQTTFLYTLPLGRGHAILGSGKGVVNQAMSNWELAGVLLFQSGPFLTAVNTAADPSGTSLSLSGTGRVDVVPGVSPYPANQTLGAWINPAAFSIPANNIGRFGYESVGYVTGPGTECVSLSLMKSVSITERARLRFGAQASNAFDHPNYGNPNLTLGTAAFGTITSLQSAEGAGPRAPQLTARLSF